MSDGILIFIWLILPILCAFFGVVILLTVPTKRLAKNVVIEFFAVFLRLFAFEHDAISKYRGPLARVALLVLILCSALYPTIRDYSQFFPSRYTLDIFFDEAGLEHAVSHLGADARQKLDIEIDWKSQRPRFFDQLNHQLLDSHVNFQFLISGPATVGSGTGFFKVRKLNWLEQRYKITEAGGAISFRTGDGDDAPTLQTGYNIVSSGGSYIEARPFSVYYPHSILIDPTFSQYIRLSPTSKNVASELIAATVISVPMFQIEQTVYLARGVKGGVIPIAYAIITPEHD